MRLSELTAAVELEVVRDAEFQSLGLLFNETPGLLVCLYDPHVSQSSWDNRTIACVLAAPELAAEVPEHLGLAVADAPRERFRDVQRYLGSSTDFYGGDFASEISTEAHVEAGAHVAPRRVRIGPGSAIEPGAVVLEGSTLAEDVVVRAGAVIGADGFHPVPYETGLVNMPHYGSVRLDRGVEVQANAVVCRSVFHDPTQVGVGTILGPLAYVAHGARIGERCRIAASARVSGSARVGSDVFVGPGAVVSNRVAIGDGARVSIGSVVVRNVPPHQTVTGNFALDHERFLSSWARLGADG